MITTLIDFGAALTTLQHIDKTRRLAEIEQDMALVIDMYADKDPEYCSNRITELTDEYDTIVEYIRKH